MAGNYTRLPSGSWRARVDVDGAQGKIMVSNNSRQI